MTAEHDIINYAKLGERIRKQRKLANLTQEALSEKVGISLPFLGHIERGTRKASLDTLVRIANALNVSTDLLLQDSLTSEFSRQHYSPDVQNILHDLTTALSRDPYLG